MSLRRKKGVQLCFPIVYGNSTCKLDTSSIEQETLGHTHRWTVYVRGCNHEDISYYIQKVTFKLHESFEQPIRTITQPPFELTQTGWGEFEIQILIYFHDLHEHHPRPVKLSHMLRLFPLESNQVQVEGLHQSMVTPSSSSSFSSSSSSSTSSGVPILIVEQMDELVLQEPSEAFYDLVIEKFQQETYPLKGVVFNRKTELMELERLRHDQARIHQSIQQLQLTIQHLESKLQFYTHPPSLLSLPSSSSSSSSSTTTTTTTSVP